MPDPTAPLQHLLRGACQDAMPGEALRCAEELRALLDRRQATLVLRLREQGMSWADIARPLGISRQALQRRAAHWT